MSDLDIDFGIAEVEEPKGMERPLLKKMLSDICDDIGFDVNQLSPFYTQMALGVLEQAEVLVGVYVLSQWKNESQDLLTRSECHG